MTQIVSYVLCAILMAYPALAAQPLPPSGAATTAPITLQQAVDRALANNPSLTAGREHLSAVHANILTARTRQDPTLTLSGQGVTLPEINNNGGNPFDYSANVSRTFERGNKRGLRIEAANATTQVTESQLHDQERQLVLSVRQAFTGMLGAKGALAIAEENLTDYHKTVDLSKARLDAGDITRTDYERIDLQLAQFESDDDVARLNMQQASAQLQQLFGVDHPSPTFDVTGTLEPPALTLTMAEAETRALATRPDYQAARQSLLLSQANARFAIANGTADPTLASEYDRSGPDNTFGVSISIPL
ncbi:MAG: TolC family protein, partial [Edaphobacter sp.]